MPIKTLHITNSWHGASGGIGTFYRALFEAANRLRRPLRMIVPGERAKIEEFGEFVRLYTIEAVRSPFFDRRYRLLLPHGYLKPRNAEILGILRAEQPDLVEICDKYSINWLAGIIRRGWVSGIGRPVLVGLSCERMDDNVRAYLSPGFAGRSWSRFYLGALYLPLFDYHIANSDYTADELRAAMRPAHERQVFVRPMGADIDAFTAAVPSREAREALLARVQGTRGTRLLLYAGRLSPEKNVMLLVDLMERLRNRSAEDYRLLVAGAGPLQAHFEAEARRRAPGRIHLLGHIADRASLIDLYTNCDAFIHPNPREPFGIAPLEAMAAGTPLVAPRAGGVLSYANDGNAWLAEPDGDQFARAAQAVFADAATRKDRLARASCAAGRFRWPDVAARFFSLYDEMHKKFPTLRFAPKALPTAAARVAHEEP